MRDRFNTYNKTFVVARRSPSIYDFPGEEIEYISLRTFRLTGSPGEKNKDFVEPEYDLDVTTTRDKQGNFTTEKLDFLLMTFEEATEACKLLNQFKGRKTHYVSGEIAEGDDFTVYCIMRSTPDFFITFPRFLEDPDD